MEDRCVICGMDVSDLSRHCCLNCERKIDNMKMLGKMLEKDFSFSETDEIIAQERKHTYEYLKAQIKSVRN